MRNATFNLLSALVVVLTSLCACADRTEMSQSENDLTKSMEEFKNRKVYPSLTEEILRSIPDAQLEQAIFDYASLKIGDNYNRELTVVRSLAPGVQALYATWLIEAEVNNGGFNQFFWNSSGAFAEDAVTGFELFGLSDLAALTRDAIGIHAAEAKEIDRFKQQNTIEAFSESYKHSKLGPLDDRFYEINETISPARIKRIRERPQLFTGS